MLKEKTWSSSPQAFLPPPEGVEAVFSRVALRASLATLLLLAQWFIKYTKMAAARRATTPSPTDSPTVIPWSRDREEEEEDLAAAPPPAPMLRKEGEAVVEMEEEVVAVEEGVAVSEGSSTMGVLVLEGVEERESVAEAESVESGEEDLEGRGEEDVLADLVSLGVALGERERRGEEEGPKVALPPPPLPAAPPGDWEGEGVRVARACVGEATVKSGEREGKGEGVGEVVGVGFWDVV